MSRRWQTTWTRGGAGCWASTTAKCPAPCTASQPCALLRSVARAPPSVHTVFMPQPARPSALRGLHLPAWSKVKVIKQAHERVLKVKNTSRGSMRMLARCSAERQQRPRQPGTSSGRGASASGCMSPLLAGELHASSLGGVGRVAIARKDWEAAEDALSKARRLLCLLILEYNQGKSLDDLYVLPQCH